MESNAVTKEQVEALTNTHKPVEGFKYDANKLRFDLLPTGPLQQLAEVYTMGAAKYSSRQWENGMDWSRCYAAAQRHMIAFWSGQDLDEESGLPHLAHAAFNLLALLEYAKTHPNLDDRVRPPNEDYAGT
jgi:hypothetical protein